MVGRHDFDGVEVIFLCKQLAVVRVSITTLIIVAAALIGIKTINNILPVIAATRYGVIAARVPIRFPDSVPDLALEAVWRPVLIPNSVLIRVAYGDHLHLW